MTMIPQIAIFLDTAGNARAEVPGPNGARQKIELPMDFLQRNPEIAAALVEQQDKNRERETQRLRDLQTQNISNVVNAKGMGMDFARKIWRDGHINFASAKVRKALQREAEAKAKSAKARKTFDPSKALDL